MEAWPLRHLLLAVLQELQIHLSSLTPEIKPSLTNSVTWDKSLLWLIVSPEGSKREVSEGPYAPASQSSVRK